jgi:hypothetical protein
MLVGQCFDLVRVDVTLGLGVFILLAASQFVLLKAKFGCGI